MFCGWIENVGSDECEQTNAGRGEEEAGGNGFK